MSKRSTANRWGTGALAALAVGGLGLLGVQRAGAQGAPLAKYSFDADAGGFTAVTIKDGAPAEDADSSATIVKEGAKNGGGALLYTYKVEPKFMRTLAGATKLPAGMQSVSLWARGDTRTQMLLTFREEDGSTYHLPFYLPSHEWVKVTVNLDELAIGENETDENNKLDVDQIAGVGLFDLATMLVNSNDAFANALPNLQGVRKVWLDDLEFSTERVPQASGLVKTDASSTLVVDNFDAGLVRWAPIKVNFGNTPPTFDLCPENVSLQTLPEAAGPGGAKGPTEPGGKGLRFTYRRGDKELFALHTSLEKRDLSRADRLRLSLNMSQKSLILVQVKEKDDSEYQTVIMPENSVGWQNLDVALSDLSLGNESQDENNTLDPAQIKEMTIVDASTAAGQAVGDVTMDLDAIRLSLK